jgi:competence protein ComEA
MFKKLVCAFALIWATASGAAVDVNKATAADLDGIKGIGPSMSGKILDERKKSPFKDWADMISRVKGIGDKKAALLTAEGLTVNGNGFNAKGPTAKSAPEKPSAVVPADTAAKK